MFIDLFLLFIIVFLKIFFLLWLFLFPVKSAVDWLLFFLILRFFFGVINRFFCINFFAPLILLIFPLLLFVADSLLKQLIHLHFDVHDFPFWKQSQYFFVQFEFLQLHVQLFLVELICKIAFGFLEIIFLYFSCLKVSNSILLWQLQQGQSLQYFPFEKHSQ